MDLINIITEKRFIGQEFLVWLWHKAATTGCVGNIATIEICDTISLETSGDPIHTVSCAGKDYDMAEAMVALRSGMMPERAKIIIHINDTKYSFLFVPATWEFRGVALPKIGGKTDDDSEAEGLILERVYLFEQLSEAMEQVFAAFLAIRIDMEEWRKEVSAISDWIFSRKEV